MSDQRQEELRRRLFELGFDDVRFAATAEPLKREPLSGWLAAGMQGEMAWMERTAEKRLDPTLVLEGVKSVILLGVSYADEPEPQPSGGTAIRPVWARYALHEDYHDTIRPALVRAGRWLEELYGAVESDYRYYVDTGPVLERSWSARAGLGFIGKNGMLISRQHGNWLFLAAILTRVEFVPDLPIRKKLLPLESSKNEDVGLLCGKCTRCLDACPTNAFSRPGVVDSRRCVSYQTIENKGIIPRELRSGIGSRIYGCDVCLEVCPWNRFAQKGRSMLLVAKHHLKDVTLVELLTLTPARFAELFRGTAMKRVKLGGLLRNACIVAGNSGDATLLPWLVKLAEHELPLVRAHAVWAIHQLAGPATAASLLAAIRQQETDTSVMSEYTAAERERPEDKPATSVSAAETPLS
ncbi:MAG TPA: tRNA epoxyqueuosine(34) reductase QueG [Opitutus sp.]|nr:tRNA epoxyqueuosine(34) reductase QueG [Opitutus sp.]